MLPVIRESVTKATRFRVGKAAQHLHDHSVGASTRQGTSHHYKPPFLHSTVQASLEWHDNEARWACTRVYTAHTTIALQDMDKYSLLKQRPWEVQRCKSEILAFVRLHDCIAGLECSWVPQLGC